MCGTDPFYFMTRIDLACNLLERPEHNVAEVGWDCEFLSPSYFISVFTRHKKATPLVWRRMQNGNMPSR